ncbi:MAG: four helix bundle protein [Opitutaceae bacterium]|nr:four helix bundle protein [Opitutaceae bacterium]
MQSAEAVEWRNLEVAKLCHDAALRVFKATEQFPRQVEYSLTKQIQRSSLSVVANIVEGKGRRTSRDLKNFLTIARGSLDETRYFLLFARDYGCLALSDYADLDKRYEIARRMLNSLIAHIN